jgi:hypothetical protein
LPLSLLAQRRADFQIVIIRQLMKSNRHTGLAVNGLQQLVKHGNDARYLLTRTAIFDPVAERVTQPDKPVIAVFS